MRCLHLLLNLSLMALPGLAVAQDAAAPARPNSPMATLMSFFPILAFGAIFYFLLFRPQQKANKERQALIAGVKRMDRVLTSGGLYGTVVNVRGDVLDLKLADNLKVEMSRHYVAKVITATVTENGSKEPTVAN